MSQQGTGGMPPFQRFRTLADQIGAYYADHGQAIGPATLGELGALFGTSKDAARDGMRVAERLLNGKHQAVTVPLRGRGWKTAVTTDQVDFLRSSLDRLSAIAKELGRYEADEAAVAQPGSVMVYAALHHAVTLAVQAVASLP